MIVLDSVESRAEARRLHGCLRLAGIAAELVRDGGAWTLRVDPAELAESQALLAAARASEREIVWVCPSCSEANGSSFEVCWRCGRDLANAPPREPEPETSEPAGAPLQRIGDTAQPPLRRAGELGVLILGLVVWPRISLAYWGERTVGMEDVLAPLLLEVVFLATLLVIAAADRPAFPRRGGDLGGWVLAAVIGCALFSLNYGLSIVVDARIAGTWPREPIFPEPDFESAAVRDAWLASGFLYDVTSGLFFARFVVERVRSFAPLPVAIGAAVVLQALAHAATVPEAAFIVGTLWLPVPAASFLRDARPVIIAWWIARWLSW